MLRAVCLCLVTATTSAAAKACIANNAICIQSQEKADDSTMLEITLSGAVSANSQYISVGVMMTSSTLMMGPADTMSCIIGSDGTISVENGSNDGAYNHHKQGTYALLSSSYVGGVLSCTFTRPKNTNAALDKAITDVEVSLMVAKGPVDAGSNLRQHNQRFPNYGGAALAYNFVNGTSSFPATADTAALTTTAPTQAPAAAPSAGPQTVCTANGLVCVLSREKAGDPTTLAIQLSGQASNGHYVSIGIQTAAVSGGSSLNGMGPADVLACLVGAAGAVTARDATNSNSYTCSMDASNSLTLLGGALVNGKVTCSFERKKDTGNVANAVIGDSLLSLMYAVGAVNGGVMLQHSNWGKSAIVYNFVTGRGDVPSSNSTLASGLMYMLILVLSFGGLVCRTFLSRNWPIHQKRVLGMTPWGGLTIGELICFGLYLVTNAGIILAHKNDLPVAFGTLAGANLGFTLMPIARNSIWVFVFGISFERAVKFHRWVARITVLCVIVHLIVVIVKLNDVSLIFSYQQVGEVIPLFGFLALLCMLVAFLFAYEAVRRKMFELFWYVHQIFYLTVVFAFIHAKSNLFLAGPALLLFAIDACFRMYGALVRAFEIESATVMAGEVTCLSVKRKGGKAFKFEAGQFCFLQIPAVSMFEVHPFSISCAPGDGITFHIKDMGPGQFTSKLKALTLAGKLTPAASIRIMGPYGLLALPKLSTFKLVVLFGGGVGITPMHSIFADLMKADKKIRTTLVWSSKGSACFTSWFPTLGVSNKEGFAVHFYDTSATGDVESVTDLLNKAPQRDVIFHGGRPDFEVIVMAAISDAGMACAAPASPISPSEVAVLACGPPSMVHKLQSLCQQKKYWFHKETFLL